MKQINIEAVNAALFDVAMERLDGLTKPKGSLGRLEEFAQRIVAITGQYMPGMLNKKIIFTFAADHGVVEEGISLYPKEVTEQMVYNFINGGAGINVLARHAGADVAVIDIGVDCNFDETHGLLIKKVMRGTKNMRNGPAMSMEEAEQCIDKGIQLAEEYADKGYRIFGTGDMGIGNTTSSSAIAAVMTGKPVSEVTDRGTGITDEALAHKIKVIKDAIALNQPNAKNPLDVLSKVGGAEIGGIAGLILGASERKIPIVVDGFISTAASMIAYAIEPKVKDYMFAAHNSVEKGHKAMLDFLGLAPILSLGLRLGEGTGAALAMLIIEAGLKIYLEMATFDEAGVSRADEN